MLVDAVDSVDDGSVTVGCSAHPVVLLEAGFYRTNQVK